MTIPVAVRGAALLVRGGTITRETENVSETKGSARPLKTQQPVDPYISETTVTETPPGGET